MKFENEKYLSKFIRDLGGTLWLVGGAVRDQLMNQPCHDKDYMITGVDISKISFERVVGSNFPVFIVKINDEKCEIAMARTEIKTEIGHKGFKFHTDESISLKDDLSRRDLTINAIAKNVLTSKIHDPFNGINDLNNHILRHTTKAFKEDPLRVFRTARFAAKFNFSIAEETKELMKQLVPELSSLPTERIWKELQKVLNTKTPSVFFKVLKEINALNVFFKEIEALDVADKHDKTAFNHTMKVMDNGRNEIERFGLLVHDFGKGKTPKHLHPQHHSHDKLGVQEVSNFCNRLKVPNKFKTFGIICAKEHMRMKNACEMRPGKFVHCILNLSKNFKAVFNVSFIDSAFKQGADYNEELNRFKHILNLANIVFKIEKRITGKLLIEQGYIPGKHFGGILFQKRVEAFKNERI